MLGFTLLLDLFVLIVTNARLLVSVQDVNERSTVGKRVRFSILRNTTCNVINKNIFTRRILKKNNLSGLMDIHTLVNKGYITTALLSSAETLHFQTRISNEIKQGKEFNATSLSDLQDGRAGGFGAFNCSTSFHATSVRELRSLVHTRLLQAGFLRDLSLHYALLYVEQLIDRFRFQSQGTRTGAEGFHRDESTGAKKGDVILGGWLNLSHETTQYFTCLEGTHRAEENHKGGFARCEPTKEEIAREVAVTVSPGHLILFFQNIVHKVHASTLKADSHRLHIGYRLTDCEAPLFDMDRIFSDFETPRLPSGQQAVMYPKLWRVNWPEKLKSFSARFIPQLYTDITRKGETISAVQQVMVPTECMKASYLPYCDAEKKKHFPHSAVVSMGEEAAPIKKLKS